MKSAPLPADESARLKALEEQNLMFSMPEEVYDDITLLATQICGTPIALLTLVGENKQWHKSKQGLAVEELPRQHSFCAHAILNPEEVMVVPDARYDERFHDNPLTKGDPHIVFYAGAPILDPDGHPLGAICVIDHRERELPDEKVAALKALAKVVNAQLELRKMSVDLVKSQGSLQVAQSLVTTLLADMEQTAKDNPRPGDEDKLATVQHLAQVLNMAVGHNDRSDEGMI